jgi:predicted nucleic acid-binding protein
LTEFDDLMKEATEHSPDEDDAPYFALALKLNSPIWTNDNALKNQDRVKILSNTDMIEVLFS